MDRDLIYMRRALAQAKKSPPKPTNFCVGAVLVDVDAADIATSTDTSTATPNDLAKAVLADGYTLELPGNTHAEQCCFLKLAAQYGVSEEDLSTVEQLPKRLALYTTMEPCSFRLSCNLPCVQRVLRLAGKTSDSAIQRDLTVYVGVQEPDKFVADNTGQTTLAASGIKVVHVTGLEDEILAVATAGHN